MAISNLALAQTGAIPGGALVGTDQIVATSGDYRKIDEGDNSPVVPKVSQNKKIQQQDNNSLGKSPLILNIVSLFFSLASFIVSVYLFLKMRSF